MSRYEPWLHPLTLTERLAAVPPGSPILRALRNRPELLEALETGYRDLLRHEGVARVEAFAVAAFTAHLHGEEVVAGHFHELLASEDNTLAALITEEAENAALPGPYGIWPPGPLSAEDLDGPAWRADPPLRLRLGARLSAGLEHAHLVTLHPRDITAGAGEALARAGWSRDEVLALNRLIAWIGALSPVVAGLRAYGFARHPRQFRQEIPDRRAGFAHG
ncbi:CMD domain protein [Pseudogemmobacter bohemicus]|uniref:CMD domain protein n=1 Tax=Pseudogemmobacter bohemicus TaxID=2250708 RepID=UPI000DD40BA0|nr:CMD domain protein [Pseudogemmobacter bohemicus]